MLKWIASLGSGALQAGALWVLAHVGVQAASVDPLMAFIVGTLVTKAATWLTRKYGPAPTPPPPEPNEVPD
jgi:hypothetical protein